MASDFVALAFVSAVIGIGAQIDGYDKTEVPLDIVELSEAELHCLPVHE